MYGDKTKTMNVMQGISSVFVDIVKEFRAQMNREEPIQVKTYYVGALKQSLINDMVINLNRRIRNLIV